MKEECIGKCLNVIRAICSHDDRYNCNGFHWVCADCGKEF